MIYLKNFDLLQEIDEHNIICGAERRNIFNSNYPLGIFSIKNFFNVQFDDITCFYGGNGSGKTTLLNIIAEKLEAIRKNAIDKGSYFNLYVENCQYTLSKEIPNEIKVITSDDIFDYLLNVRAINANVNRQKEKLSQEYLEAKFSKASSSLDNYIELKKSYDSKNMTMSKYVRQKLGNNNIIEHSNGEEALMFWEREITENSIYILDEPENSLSAENQLKLKQYIEDSVRFYNCQFIISTHSPFLLTLTGAKIYDLDDKFITTKKWTELKNVLVYYNFFKEKEEEFKN